MKWAIQLGRWLVGSAVLALGMQSLLLTTYVMRLQPVPDWVPGKTIIADATGVFLVVAATCILLNKRARLASSALALLFLLWTSLLYLPGLIANPADGSLQAGTFEVFALFGAAWILAATLPVTGKPHSFDILINRGITLGRICFGISLPVFGLTHFEFHNFVATMIPSWIPGRLFFAYFTGVAHIAAGIGIVTGILSRLAAILLGIMFGSWVLLVHIPRTIAAPHDAFEWNGIFVAMALCGGAWLCAGVSDRSLRQAPLSENS